jgi:hypothetical protein
MLACKHYTEITLIDAIYEAGQGRRKPDDECHDRTPVCGKLGRVAVYAIELVHVWDRDIASADDVVAAHRLVCRDKPSEH